MGDTAVSSNEEQLSYNPFDSTMFFVLGIFLNTLSSFFGALGDTMIRKAFLNQKEIVDLTEEPSLEPVSVLSTPSQAVPVSPSQQLPPPYPSEPPSSLLSLSLPSHLASADECVGTTFSAAEPSRPNNIVLQGKLDNRKGQTLDDSVLRSYEPVETPSTPSSLDSPAEFSEPLPNSLFSSHLLLSPPLGVSYCSSPDQPPFMPPFPMSIASGSNTPPREHSNSFNTHSPRTHPSPTLPSHYMMERLKSDSPKSPVSVNSSVKRGAESSKGQKSTIEPFTPNSLYSSSSSAFPSDVAVPESRSQSLSSSIAAFVSGFRSNHSTADSRPLLSSATFEHGSPVPLDVAPPPPPPIYKQPLWLGGMFLSAAMCPLFNVCAMEFLPASVVGFAGVQIIFVMVLARAWLREKISLYNFFGAVLVIGGLFMLSFSSGRDPVFNTLDDFWGYLYTLQAILYFSITGGIALFGICYYADSGVTWLGDSFCGLCSWCTHFQRIMLPSTAGLFGGYAVLSAKAMMMAITSIMTQPHNSLSKIVKQWKAVFIILVTIACALTELLFINRSLQKYQAFSVVPIVNSVITLSGAVGGLLVFQEYPSKPILWSFGLAMIIAGVMALSYAHQLVAVIRGAAAFLRRRSARVSATAAAFEGGRVVGDNSSGRLLLS
eukprot:GHVS01029908.1.p1 GENE.GHVS01029908.1~~GHVS01029908.1.p1  ORF type:complete len:659 (+),score=98.58 GHVS01029908.1:170-2146(+)